MTQTTTTLDVANELELNQAIATADAATSGDYVIQFTGNITETGILNTVSLASGVSLTVSGDNGVGSSGTLNGNGSYQGLFVQAGQVTIQNLVIADATARGGNGTGGGGGGAGLGGGLFVGNAGTVTINNVSFTNNSAIGGNGGRGRSPGKGGSLDGRPSGYESGFGRGGAGRSHGTSNGGFGAGGGAPPLSSGETGRGGFGAGNGSAGSTASNGGGGGGLGAGGDVFLQQGGTLIIESGALGAGTVLPGTGGGIAAASRAGGTADAFGSSLFVEGNATATLAPQAGTTLTVAGGIADELGSLPTESAGEANLVLAGAGTVVLDGADTFAGGTTIDSGTLRLNNPAAAGKGAIAFAGAATLEIGLNDAPPNIIKGFLPGDTIDLEAIGLASVVTPLAGNTLAIVGPAGTLDLTLDPTQDLTHDIFTLAPDGSGGTDVTAVHSTVAHIELGAANELQLNQAIATANAATSGNYVINLTGNITEGTDTDGIITFGAQTLGAPGNLYGLNLKPGVSFTLNGDGFTLNANGDRGLFVYAGTVSVSGLTIANAVAQGGSGGAGAGGGAGLGGGLFVAAGGNVTLTSVTFTDNSAIGGKGGRSQVTAGASQIAGGGGGMGSGGTDYGRPGGLGVVIAGVVSNFGDGSPGGGGNSGGFGGGAGFAPGLYGISAGMAGFGGGGAIGHRAGFGGGGGGPLQIQYHTFSPSVGIVTGAGSYGPTGSFQYHSTTNGGSGGGGLGAGGDIFIQQGGKLAIDSGTLGAGAVAGGAAGGRFSHGGAAYGGAIYLQGNQTQTLAPAAGTTLDVQGAIADADGSGGLLIDGPGTVELDVANSYGGGTTINNGTLILGAPGAAGSGAIVFNPAANATLEFTAADAPAATQPITGFAQGDAIVLTGFAETSKTYVPGTGLQIGNGATTVTLDITGYTNVLQFGDIHTFGGNTTIALLGTVGVGSETALTAAIATAEAATPGTYDINFTSNITLTSALPEISLPSGVALVIDGEGQTLDGNGAYQGLFLAAGTFSVDALTIADARAQGGSGGAGSTNFGGGGGGGAGLGGGLFVSNVATVVAAGVNFIDDSAFGGNGAPGDSATAIGGGGAGGGLDGGAGGGTGGNFFTNHGGQTGGFGGGGGGGAYNGDGGAGGFGGGGGGAGAVAFGSGALGGAGGFGAGTGGQSFFDLPGGGGGGLGAGGDIFVQQGGILTLDSGDLAAGTVGGGGGTQGGSGGSGIADGIFLQGNQSQVFAPAAGQTLTVAGKIADQTGSGGSDPNAGAGTIVVDGAGIVALDAANSYSGGTTIEAGTLSLGGAGASGSGPIRFAGSLATLEFSAAAAPSSSIPITGFAVSDTIDIAGFIETGDSFVSGTGLELASAAGGITLNLPGFANDTLAGLPFQPTNVVTTDGSNTTIAQVGGSFAVQTEAELQAAIAAVESANPGTYTINFAADITESANIATISLPTGVLLTIDGDGNTLDGNDGAYQGLSVGSGSVTIADLTIADATAHGGNGASGGEAGGGGGAGLGGGLLVGSAGTVTLESVVFSNDGAAGGNGGNRNLTGTATGGAGGGLNGGAGGGAGSGGSAAGGAGSYGGGGGGGAGSLLKDGQPAESGGMGGFGGGGGGGWEVPGAAGGFGGGAGASNEGGGGLGAGADIAVLQGGSLIVGGGSLGAGTVVGGSGGSGYVASQGSPGSGFGTGVFLAGNQAQSLAPGMEQTLTIAGVIADQTGSGGNGANAGAGTIDIDGAGTVALDAVNTYSGGTSIDQGTLILGATRAAGSGPIGFGANGAAVLAFSTANAPANVIGTLQPDAHIDITNLPIASATIEHLSSADVLAAAAGGKTIDLTFAASAATQTFFLSPDGNGGTDIGLLNVVPTGKIVSLPTINTGDEDVVASGGTVVDPKIVGGTLDLDAGSAVTGTIAFGGDGGRVVFESAAELGTTISGFVAGDSIKLAGVGYNSLTDSVSVQTPGVVTAIVGGVDYNFHIAGATVGETGFAISGDLLLTTDMPCYCRGTRILTPAGEVAVEQLAVGDLVITASGALRPVIWIGFRRLSLTNHPDKPAVWPVRVAAGAFGAGTPHSDLWLSPGHNVVAEGVLIPISALINGATIVQHRLTETEYWHVELDAHDIMFANGLAAESYLDTGNRCAFQNGGAFIEAFPDFVPKHNAETCLPVVGFGPEVVRAKTALLARAAAQAPPTTDDADLHIMTDGRRFEPTRLGDRRYGFLLPRGCREISLRSRDFVPAYTDPECDDRRILGVCVNALAIDGKTLRLDDAGYFERGWLKHELWADGRLVRWTDGSGCLPNGGRMICIGLELTGRYQHRAEAKTITGAARAVCC